MNKSILTIIFCMAGSAAICWLCDWRTKVIAWYEFPVSDSQAYKMLGNGWTCEVIAHILKYLEEA